MIESLTSISGFSRETSSVGASRNVFGPAAGIGVGAAGGAPDFGQVLAQVSADAVGTLKAGEAAAISGIQGKASVQQVVEAIMSAEKTLQTAIAVRDKVVSAYQEISRMSI